MTHFTDEQVADWAGLQRQSDPRWSFAIQKHLGERWLFGARGGGWLVFPMYSLDRCEHSDLEDAFNAFFGSDGWKEVVRRSGCDDGISSNEEVKAFEKAKRKLSNLRIKMADKARRTSGAENSTASRSPARRSRGVEN